MGDLLKRIYNDIILCEEATININREVEGRLKRRVEPYTSKLDGEEKEAFEDMCHDIFYYAEYSGFRIGMKYALELIIEILGK